MTKGRIIGLVIIVVIVIMQLIPTDKPEVIKSNPNGLLVNNQFSDSVSRLLKNACYDCHSNETKYPWYSYIAPVSWLVERDTRIGRTNLNFSDWETYSKMDKAKILDELIEEVEGGNMPMPIYILMHPEAKLSVSDRELLIEWSDEFAESLFE